MEWTYEVHELSEGFSAIVYDEHGRRIADHLTEEQAQLIAAAHDLLEALSEARTELLLMRNNIMEEMRLSEGAAYRFEGVPDILQKRIDAIDAAIAKAGGAS